MFHFKTISSFIVGAVLVGAVAHAEPRARELAWLSGSWVSEADGTRGDLQFLPPGGGMLLGTNRLVAGEVVTFAEFTRIEEKNGTLVLSPTPLFLLTAGKTGVSFKLKSLEKNRVEFENPEHDFPKVIVYELKDGNRLLLHVEGKKEGFPPVLETNYQKN
jgi:hypothetical protein